MLRTFNKTIIGFTIIALVSISSIVVAETQTTAANTSIIPQPLEINVVPERGRAFTITSSTKIVYDSRDAKQPAEMLAAYLRPATGFDLPVIDGRTPAGNDFLLSIASVNPKMNTRDDRGNVSETYQCCFLNNLHRDFPLR